MESLCINNNYSTIQKKRFTRSSCSFLKKHIRNAKQLEKDRKNEFIHRRVSGWLSPSDQNLLSSDDLQTFLKKIKLLAAQIGLEFTQKLHIPTVFYADQFVKIDGLPLDVDGVFHLLFISAVVSLKFWEESYKIDLAEVAKVAGISKRAICESERNFLQTIDYSLHLTDRDIEHFLGGVQFN